jgi:NAD(P)-dependent dehydrogenase (short-subunit alcohol dehydrogenase family)
LGHHFPAAPVKLSAIADLNQELGGQDNIIGNMNRYGLSKLANVLFARELQKRLFADGTSILSISLHPGNISTTGAIRVTNDLGASEALKGAITPAEGALTPLFAAAHPRVWKEKETFAGAFLVPYGKTQEVSEDARRSDLAESLWALSEEIVKSYRA